MRRHDVSRAHKTKTLRAVTKLKGKGINVTGACQLTRAQQVLHMISTKSPFCAILKNIPPVLTFTAAHIREMRGTRTYCSSACLISYAQGNRHWGCGHHPRGSRMQQRIRVNITRPLISTHSPSPNRVLENRRSHL